MKKKVFGIGRWANVNQQLIVLRLIPINLCQTFIIDQNHRKLLLLDLPRLPGRYNHLPIYWAHMSVC